MNIDTNKRTSHPKTIDPNPPPSKTHTINQIREIELNNKHREYKTRVLGLDMASRLIGMGHFRPPVLGPSKGQSGVLYSGSALGYL